jgi:cell division protein FtsI (penicillin-binding protein 3)
MTTLVARPTRTRHSGSRQQSLALSHQRLMLLMLVFLGVGCVIAGRIVWINIASDAVAAPGAAIAARADLVDRNGSVLARTIEAHSIGVHPNRLLGKSPS